jgi:hypothetical protein
MSLDDPGRAAMVEAAFLQRRGLRGGERWMTDRRSRASMVVRTEDSDRWVEVWHVEAETLRCFYRLSYQDHQPREIGTHTTGETVVHTTDHVLGGVLGGPTGRRLTAGDWQAYAAAWLRSTAPAPSPPGPLETAARSGNLEAVCALTPGASAEELTLALASAVSNEHRDVAAHLLAAGADPNALVPGWRGGTALHAAAEDSFDADLLRLLLAHGADVNARDAWGLTPLIMTVSHALDWVVQRGAPPHTACAAALLAHGADPHIPAYLGHSLFNDPALDAERHPELEPLPQLWRDA